MTSKHVHEPGPEQWQHKRMTRPVPSQPRPCPVPGGVGSETAPPVPQAAAPNGEGIESTEVGPRTNTRAGPFKRGLASLSAIEASAHSSTTLLAGSRPGEVA